MNLGDATDVIMRPLPGYSIPHHFSAEEIQQFLATHKDNAELQRYLESGQPAYGIIVKEAYGDILVWFDASARLQVVDVTNMSIAKQVQQAPFESPDSDFFTNLQQSFQNLFAGAEKVAYIAIAVAVIVLAFKVLK